MRWLLIVTALGLAALATACSDGSDGADLKTFLAGPTPLSREAAIDKLRTMVLEDGAGFYAVGCISWPGSRIDVCDGNYDAGTGVTAGLPLEVTGQRRLWSPAGSDCGYGGTNQPKHPHLIVLKDQWGRLRTFQRPDLRQVELDGRTCLVPQ